jgi:hypothetical protein
MLRSKLLDAASTVGYVVHASAWEGDGYITIKKR